MQWFFKSCHSGWKKNNTSWIKKCTKSKIERIFNLVMQEILTTTSCCGDGDGGCDGLWLCLIFGCLCFCFLVFVSFVVKEHMKKIVFKPALAVCTSQQYNCSYRVPMAHANTTYISEQRKGDEGGRKQMMKKNYERQKRLWCNT